jgi:predicted Zn-dependent protease
MYVYTTAAKNRVGGTANMRRLIQNTITRFNQSFINSNMDININLVYTKEISYTLDTVNLTSQEKYLNTLEHLTYDSDGYMDEVHILRERYSADLVHMFIENNAHGGLGWVNSTHSSNSAFSLSSVNVQVSNPLLYAMKSSIHEIGHNFGLYHAPDNAYPLYARGYTTSSLGTIMGANYINYWSSPYVFYNGMATGTADNNARRAILEQAYTIANFRQRPVTTSPTLTTSPPSETLNNSATIEVNGEAGYEVYVNGTYKGVIASNGKKTLTLTLADVHNNFSITLKHAPSGTVSNTLTFSIIKKIDTDSDGIYDHIEENLGLNPNSADSDADGYTDLEEVGDINNPTDTDNDGIIDALDEDSDNDGVSDKDERLASIILVTVIVPYILQGN